MMGFQEVTGEQHAGRLAANFMVQGLLAKPPEGFTMAPSPGPTPAYCGAGVVWPIQADQPTGRGLV